MTDVTEERPDWMQAQERAEVASKDIPALLERLENNKGGMTLSGEDVLTFHMALRRQHEST